MAVQATIYGPALNSVSVLPLTLSGTSVGINNAGPTLDLAIGTDFANPYGYDHGITISTPATTGHSAGIFLAQTATRGVTLHWASTGALGGAVLQTYLRQTNIDIDAQYLRLQTSSDALSVMIGNGVADDNSKLLINRTGSNNTSGNVPLVSLIGSFTPASGTATYRPLSIAYGITQTGGANGTVTGIFVNATETTVVGTHNLIDLQVGGTSYFKVGGTAAGAGVTGLSFFNATAAAKQTSGANLTNNVTSGGSSDTITDWTNLTTYSTDAAAIRNAVYQLARKLKQINDGLRTYGLFT